MRWLLITTTGVLCLVALERCAQAECLTTPRAVWREHPRAHATWNLVDGHQCWRVGVPSRHATHRDRRSYGSVAPVPTVPLPPLRRDRLTPDEGRALADYLLPPTPFQERWP